jgi:hypothetical protein
VIDVGHRFHLKDVTKGIDHANAGELGKDGSVKALSKSCWPPPEKSQGPANEHTYHLSNNNDPGDCVCRCCRVVLGPFVEGVAAGSLPQSQ